MNITEQAAKVLAEIDEQLALADKATAGPWATKLSIGDYNVKVTNIWTNIVGKRIGAITHKNPDHESNAAFIAAARTVCPKSLRIMRDFITEYLDDLQGAEEDGDSDTVRAIERRLAKAFAQWNENK